MEESIRKLSMDQNLLWSGPDRKVAERSRAPDWRSRQLLSTEKLALQSKILVALSLNPHVKIQDEFLQQNPNRRIT